jgi:hypothetical protein
MRSSNINPFYSIYVLTISNLRVIPAPYFHNHRQATVFFARPPGLNRYYFPVIF